MTHWHAGWDGPTNYQPNLTDLEVVLAPALEDGRVGNVDVVVAQLDLNLGRVGDGLLGLFRQLAVLDPPLPIDDVFDLGHGKTDQGGRREQCSLLHIFHLLRVFAGKALAQPHSHVGSGEAAAVQYALPRCGKLTLGLFLGQRAKHGGVAGGLDGVEHIAHLCLAVLALGAGMHGEGHTGVGLAVVDKGLQQRHCVCCSVMSLWICVPLCRRAFLAAGDNVQVGFGKYKDGVCGGEDVGDGVDGMYTIPGSS